MQNKYACANIKVIEDDALKLKKWQEMSTTCSYLEDKCQAREGATPEVLAMPEFRLDDALRLSSVYGGNVSDGVELLVNARSRRRRSTEVKLGCRLTGLPRLPLVCSLLVGAVKYV